MRCHRCSIPHMLALDRCPRIHRCPRRRPRVTNSRCCRLCLDQRRSMHRLRLVMHRRTLRIYRTRCTWRQRASRTQHSSRACLQRLVPRRRIRCWTFSTRARAYRASRRAPACRASHRARTCRVSRRRRHMRPMRSWPLFCTAKECSLRIPVYVTRLA